MKISYYPGCTLKTKAKNLEDSALAALAALGIEVEELERWNCCGAVYSLADDDLIHLVAPARDLIRAKDAGADKVVTLCSQCYNVLARTNNLMRDDEEKRKTLNLFMDEETDYAGEVEVVHYLDLLHDVVGFDALREKVKVPLEGLKIAPFYGCSLVRPYDVAVGGKDHPTIYQEFIEALGATPVDYAAVGECCGSYEVLVHPEEGRTRASKVLTSAEKAGADAMMLSCPLCEYNLGKKQAAVREQHSEVGELPVYYFTQLLAIALGLEVESCHFDLNMDGAQALLEKRSFVSAPSA
ncbi:MAG: CoB--CoM heterodisulfide reductase iron-sulfur subunit B family protein [Deltaproteobacteria bacterium]|nr:CoB--CoM heterodisulfide reductase iron-sulfur subunit B family protein [Deltaproteobacteria bacterium]